MISIDDKLEKCTCITKSLLYARKRRGSRIDPFCNLCHFYRQNLLFAAYLKRKMIEDV